jgi:FtsH-binding integral membrane protein
VISILALIFGSAGADEENGTPNGRPMHMVVPYNYILLGIFTVCISICIAKIANASEPQIVFEAFCLTTAAVIGITFYAMTGLKKVKGIEKFSIMTPALSAVGMIFAVTGLFVFLPVTNLVKSKEAVVEGEAPSGTNYRVFYAAIAIVLFSIIMLFDTA